MTDKTAEQIKAEQLKDAETLVTADKLEKARKAKERKAQREKELKEAQVRMVKQPPTARKLAPRGENPTGSDFTMEPEPVTVEEWPER